MMTTFLGKPITPAELGTIIKMFQPETETKSMKPKVQWRCLKTDAPREGRYWFSGKCGAVELLWLDEKVNEHAYARAPLDDLLRLNWTHWAPYEAPEPPPKPTPFEVWWNKNSDDGKGWENSQVGIVVKPGPIKVTHWVSGPASKQIFEAGYEACAKNMASGGAK